MSNAPPTTWTDMIGQIDAIGGLAAAEKSPAAAEKSAAPKHIFDWKKLAGQFAALSQSDWRWLTTQTAALGYIIDWQGLADQVATLGHADAEHQAGGGAVAKKPASDGGAGSDHAVAAEKPVAAAEKPAEKPAAAPERVFDKGYSGMATPFGEMVVYGSPEDGWSFNAIENLICEVGYDAFPGGKCGVVGVLEAFYANHTIVEGVTFCGCLVTAAQVLHVVTTQIAENFSPQFLDRVGGFNPLYALVAGLTHTTIRIEVPVGHSHTEWLIYEPPVPVRILVTDYVTLHGGD